MEQIEQALRRARGERRLGVALPGSQRARTSQSKNNAASQPVELTYTQTRIERPSQRHLENNRVVAFQLNHRVTDTYRALRAQVLQRLARAKATTLGITSVDKGEGKTLTAVNLAIAIAMDVNQTVLLVDADLRDPGIARCMGIGAHPSLGDYLAGRASIPDCLVNPGLERLAVLPASGGARESAELLSSPRMAQLAQELKARYRDRIVIYDLPPLLTVGDTIGFLPNVEATMLVVRDGQASGTDIRRAVALLGEHNMLGTLLNAAK